MRQYDYRPPWSTILLGTLFFGVAAAGLFVAATSSESGLLINRLIRLSPEEAALFLRLLGSLSLGFVLLCGMLAFVRLKLRQHIVLSDTGITVPRSRWSARENFVPFSRIVSASVTRVGRERFLKIEYDGGKFVLNASMLPTESNFEEIREAVLLRSGV